MDEPFLQSALEKIGERNVLSIKVMRNKFSGEPASYGFVNFDNDHQALMAMHKLNGKVIPNTNPVRFTNLPNLGELYLIFLIACKIQIEPSKHKADSRRTGLVYLGRRPNSRSGRFGVVQIFRNSIRHCSHSQR